MKGVMAVRRELFDRLAASEAARDEAVENNWNRGAWVAGGEVKAYIAAIQLVNQIRCPVCGERATDNVIIRDARTGEPIRTEHRCL